MARSHPGLRLLTNYLRIDFPWKKPYVCETDEIKQTFTYDEV